MKNRRINCIVISKAKSGRDNKVCAAENGGDDGGG